MLIDRTGRNLKMEPLATVSSLERHLLKMVTHFKLFLVHRYVNSLSFFVIIAFLDDDFFQLGLHMSFGVYWYISKLNIIVIIIIIIIITGILTLQ